MIARYPTQQRLDPLGTLAARSLSPTVAAFVLCYSVIATVMQQDQISNPLLAGLAVVAMAGAACILAVATQPAYSPFGARTHYLLLSLAVVGYILEQLSRWGSNLLVQDDFGPAGIGLMLLALAPYRPWREILASGTVAALVAVAVILPQAPSFQIDVPVVVFAVVAVVQILAPTAAGAAYSRRVVKSILAWQKEARRAILARTEEARGQVARAVVEQQITALKSGVIPFLSGVLDRGTLTAVDIARAGQLAADVRRALVAEVDRTWLDSVAARERATLAERGTPGLLVVADPEHRATAFRAEQRAATAALIGAVCAARGFDPHSLVVQINGSTAAAPATSRVGRRGTGGTSGLTPHTIASPAQVDTITIQAVLDLPPRKVRALLRPYLGVIRVIFGNVRLTVRRPRLTIEFDGVREPDEVMESRQTPATPAGVRARQAPREVR